MTDTTALPDNDFGRSLALQQHMLSFTGHMQSSTQLADGFLTTRIVGEFSAGKTRLLRELLGELIPEPLFPISSLERQTRLQLEITYGDIPELTLTQREFDYSPSVPVKSLAHFPERHELLGLDPMQHRLRLSINEPRLILQNGDGYSDDKTPKRLFLIDTPGWNSGDDELAEQDAASIMTGVHNLALVYVSQAGRLDGATNANHLRDFMSVLADAEFLDQAKMLLVITSCPPEEAEHLKRRTQALVHQIWNELGREASELDLDVFPIDFQQVTATELQRFRDRFWNSLLAPLGQPAQQATRAPWVAALSRWPASWDIRPHLSEAAELLERAENLLHKAHKEGEFVKGMNMYRLIGLDNKELCNKVMTAWLRQLESDRSTLENWAIASLPKGHPLTDWWCGYWQAEIEQVLKPVRTFFKTALRAIQQLKPETEDLQRYLQSELAGPHAQALSALSNSFAHLVRTATALCKEPATEKQIATLFTLSLLQARYEDYYSMHMAELGMAR
jgi:hypothetical protein